jgi:hypothetical protein
MDERLTGSKWATSEMWNGLWWSRCRRIEQRYGVAIGVESVRMSCSSKVAIMEVPGRTGRRLWEFGSGRGQGKAREGEEEIVQELMEERKSST